MYYELRRYYNGEFHDYDVIFSGTIEQIARFLFENGFESYLDFEKVKFYAVSESQVNKSLLQTEILNLEKESN